ncbi:MAG: S1C family serine protease, partial [Chloroflexota bacterium]|nr:S1C family serine protease [Chloroflexota bacterium]
GLAIPTGLASSVASALMHGGVRRPYLGIGTQVVSLPAAIRSKLETQQETGLMLITVEPEGPAERAGLLIGDVLLRLEGTPLQDTNDLLSRLTPDRVGQPVQVLVVRGGELREISVTLGQRS